MSLTITSEPAAEPLSTAEAKLHCRVDNDDEDSYIDALVKAARRWVEQVTWRQLITATYVMRQDAFCGSHLYIPRPPLQSVTHIKYLDLNGTLTTWDAANYEVDIYSSPGRIRPIATGSWPSVGSYQNAVVVTYVAGYGTAGSSVPEELRMAIRGLVGHWYNHRESVDAANLSEAPMFVKMLTAPYRLHDERVQEHIS